MPRDSGLAALGRPKRPEMRQQTARLAAGLALLGLTACRWLYSTSAPKLETFTASSPLARLAGRREGRDSSAAALSAYEPIHRRDPTVNANMQKWITQQLKVLKRSEAGGWSASEQQKLQYLAKLGLADKIKDRSKKKPWHLNHIKAGDVFVGFLQHPDLNGGERVDLEIVATSETEGTWTSSKGGFSSSVTVKQDFPITWEQGPQRDMDIATYIFHKYNAGWRDFSKPVPAPSDMERLSLKGMRLFFLQVAQAENFPEESDYNEACADPNLGMTREEFINYIKSEDPTYLDVTFDTIFTGRRIRLFDEDLALDGDFQKEADNLIYGYAQLNGAKGGTFELELKLK